MWHALPMANHLCDDDGTLLCDFVGHLESYEEDARRLSDLLGIQPLQVSEKTALNVRQKTTPWQDMYDDKTRAIVHAKFHADFVLFGYTSAIAPKKAPPSASPAKAAPPSSAPTLTREQQIKRFVFVYIVMLLTAIATSVAPNPAANGRAYCSIGTEAIRT